MASNAPKYIAGDYYSEDFLTFAPLPFTAFPCYPGAMEPVILASGSLRRQDLFHLLGIPFSIMPSQVDETAPEAMGARELTEYLAKKKVNGIMTQLQGRLPFWVCGADTVVSINDEVFGKPKDTKDARRMLSLLRGRKHEVITAVALFKGKTGEIDCRSVTSGVTFSSFSDGELEWYLDTGEWQGAAGAYKVQGLASCFVSGIEGSYSSIMGLPIHEFYVMLRENGYPYGAALQP